GRPLLRPVVSRKQTPAPASSGVSCAFTITCRRAPIDYVHVHAARVAGPHTLGAQVAGAQPRQLSQGQARCTVHHAPRHPTCSNATPTSRYSHDVPTWDATHRPDHAFFGWHQRATECE